MKKNKYIAAGLLMLSLLFLLGGCGPAPARQIEVPEGHILITDILGRKVVVPKNPQYVAPIFAPSLHIIAMLGDTDKVVALSAGNLRDILFVEIFPSLLDARVPKEGGSTPLNIEELFKDPAPQIIFCDPATVHDDRVMRQLELFGVPVVAVNYDSIEELKFTFSLLGEIMGREERAADYIAYFENTLTMILARIGNMPNEEKKIVYHAVNELLRTDIANTLSGQWLPMMGIISAGSMTVEGADSDSKNYISLERLLQIDPEYIIINGADVYDYIYSDRGSRLHVLKAYKNDNIYLLPMGVTRWGHPNSLEAPLAMIWVAQLFHPELFTDIDIVKEIKDFYRRFFDYELEDEWVKLILEGRDLRGWRYRD